MTAAATRPLFLLIGAALLGYLFWRLEPRQVLEMLGQVGWQALPICLFFAAYQATRAAALRLSVLQPGALRYRDALWIRLSGEAVQGLTFTGPFLAEPTKAWLLGRRGLTLREGFAATITEYLIYTFVSAGMLIAALLYLRRYVDLAPVVAGVAGTLVVIASLFLAAAAVAIARRFYLIGTIVAWLARAGLLRGRLRPDIESINRMEDLLLAVLRDQPARFAGIAAIEIGAQAFLILEIVWVLDAIGLAAPAIYVFLIEASTKFISLAFFYIPTQVGAAEGTYAVIFATLGLPAAAGFALALMRRLRTLLVAGAGLAAINVVTRPRQPR